MLLCLAQNDSIWRTFVYYIKWCPFKDTKFAFNIVSLSFRCCFITNQFLWCLYFKIVSVESVSSAFLFGQLLSLRNRDPEKGTRLVEVWLAQNWIPRLGPYDVRIGLGLWLILGVVLRLGFAFGPSSRWPVWRWGTRLYGHWIRRRHERSGLVFWGG